MGRFHIAIVTTAVCALEVFGTTRAFGQGQARLFDDLEVSHATRGSVSSHGPTTVHAFGRFPLAFVENRGQFDERSCFVARWGGMTAYFTRDAFVLQLVSRPPQRHSRIDLGRNEETSANDDVFGANVFLTFEGASVDVAVEGSGELSGRYNYFIGNDPSRWRTEVPGYGAIRYRGLYPGIDVVVRTENGRLEYDLLLAPGAEPAEIVVHCEGAESLCIDEDGSLVLNTAAGPLEQPRPATYQIGAAGDREPIRCSYRLLSQDRFGFDVPSRAREELLVIDPGLVYSTFLGGTGDDNEGGFALDPTGAVVATGHTDSSDFPSSPGAYDTTFNGGLFDVFVAKLSADGSSLLYATFLGGSANDDQPRVTVDAAGAAFVTGHTDSADYPTTPGAYDTSFNGADDVFVTKLSADGSTLLYSTFLGGSASDVGQDIAVDANAAALVTGFTHSSNFPTTPGAFDTSFNGSNDAFVAKLNANGTSLLYSTFLGGSGEDGSYVHLMDLALDATGAAHVTGTTNSSDFPTTPGAFDTTFNGANDVFVAALSADGSALLYSTFLGGSSLNYPGDIAVDATGAAFVTGFTYSSDFPTTSGAFDTTINGAFDTFVSKLSANGGSLVYSTFLGGTNRDSGGGIAVDILGAVFVSGATDSFDFPTTNGAYDTSFNGSNDAFVTKLSTDGSSLQYSTFLGGSSSDGANSIAVDVTGAVVVAGAASSSDFPTTPGAYDTTYNGGSEDGFLSKLELVAGECQGDPGFTLTVPSEAPIGEFIDICTGAPAGDLVALLASLGHGPTVTPYGTFCLDFPPLVLFTFVMPGSGSRCFHRYITCAPDLVGVTGYLQFVALTPGGAEDGLSNQSPVTVVDHGGCG
jgi:hypothetical protein